MTRRMEGRRFPGPRRPRQHPATARWPEGPRVQVPSGCLHRSRGLPWLRRRCYQAGAISRETSLVSYEFRLF